MRRRFLLPGLAFLAVFSLHLAWSALGPEQDRAQEGWLAVGDPEPWWQRYLRGQEYWMGFTYALSLSFAVAALRRWREQRCCGAGRMALGGLSLSGCLALAGCWLLGCCGSPLLVVYLSLFGGAFVPLARALVAGLAALSLAIAWWRLERGASDC
ncbi:MAG TPA: hypothetical protein VNO81_12130 [Candidatus Nitrosotenuis sp.]|jgi:hypothetical protein|nr:hypothetical protein [Candidatus Nitrosotenuis sp.]